MNADQMLAEMNNTRSPSKTVPVSSTTVNPTIKSSNKMNNNQVQIMVPQKEGGYTAVNVDRGSVEQYLNASCFDPSVNPYAADDHYVGLLKCLRERPAQTCLSTVKNLLITFGIMGVGSALVGFLASGGRPQPVAWNKVNYSDVGELGYALTSTVLNVAAPVISTGTSSFIEATANSDQFQRYQEIHHTSPSPNNGSGSGSGMPGVTDSALLNANYQR